MTRDGSGPGGLTILGTGRAVPGRVVRSADLDREHRLAPGSIEAMTGVVTRHVCDGESQIDLAVAAAERAMAEAQVGPEEIDLVLSAAAVPYQPIPATAPAIQRALGIADGAAYAFDVNSTCLGFATALQVADGLIAAGRARRVLIVSAEVASRALPWATQPDIAGLFGDGAGAAVVGPGSGRLVAARFRTWAGAYDACAIGAGGTRFDLDRERAAFLAHSKFTMDGRELFRVTAKHFAGFVDALLAEAGTRREEIARVIAHQASPGALAHLTRLCGFRADQVVTLAAEVGNQIAASIPFVLDHAREAGLVRAGDRIAVLGTSAGVSFGGLVLDL